MGGVCSLPPTKFTACGRLEGVRAGTVGSHPKCIRCLHCGCALPILDKGMTLLAFSVHLPCRFCGGLVTVGSEEIKVRCLVYLTRQWCLWCLPSYYWKGPVSFWLCGNYNNTVLFLCSALRRLLLSCFRFYSPKGSTESWRFNAPCRRHACQSAEQVKLVYSAQLPSSMCTARSKNS